MNIPLLPGPAGHKPTSREPAGQKPATGGSKARQTMN